MLSDAMIRGEAANRTVYARGVDYFRRGHVLEVKFDKPHRSFHAAVTGETFYNVSVYFNEQLVVDDYDCTCPAYYQYEGACKHVIALMKTIEQNWNNYFPYPNAIPFADIMKKAKPQQGLNTDPRTLILMNLYEQEISRSVFEAETPAPNTQLIPIYHCHVSGNQRQHFLEFQIGNKRPYVMKDITAFLDAYRYNHEIVYGKNYTFCPEEAIWDACSLDLLQLMVESYQDQKDFQRWSYSYNAVFFDKKYMRLTNHQLINFLQIMSEQPFDMFINHKRTNHVRILQERPQLPVSLHSILGGVTLSLDLTESVCSLDFNNQYLYQNGYLYHVDFQFAKNTAHILQAFSDSDDLNLTIADQDVSRFFTTVLPVLEKTVEVTLDPTLEDKYYYEEPEKRVYFDRHGDGMAARIEFQYNTQIINPTLQQPANNGEPEERTLLRALHEEQQLIQFFQRHQFQLIQGTFVQEDEALIFDFLQEGLPMLDELADIYYSDDFKQLSINRTAQVSPGVRLDPGSNLLSLSLDYTDISPKEFAEVLKAYKLKKNYYRMKNGSFLPLDNNAIQSVAEIIENLGISSHDTARGEIQLPGFRALYLDRVTREKGLALQRNSAFKTLVREIREPQETDYEPPANIQAKLRHYQEDGFKWLKTLSAYGFGGILADDMGLGKTLQVLCLLLSEKTTDSLPSLVIAPTSLVYHWQDEARRFAPDLNVIVISGTQSERMETMQSLDSCDLAVTSYALIKRDLEQYQQVAFRYCILDEAQNIKNPTTLVAKTVKQIQASGRFALTGTPIENSLTELWSIFDFLMPGYLLNHNKFKGRYEVPIVKNNQPEAMQDLKRHIQPFILRRMKKEVLQELPPKIENQMSAPMTKEQRKIYLAYLMQAQKEFQDEIAHNGFERSQIKILSILTRLRQVCCHPSLFIDNYQAGSGKLDLLMEILQDAIDSGHRVLIFSQFTIMLGLIKTELTLNDISYYYLDGSTPAQERLKLVQSFNTGDQKVFLISLKAGGTGLNLTGADVVIHYDPWWNPAVEDQATDRVYRIGQKNAVQVIKLISKDSIEEKIYALQQKKKALIDAVIQPGDNFLHRMTETEIRSLFDL
ncbi:MAG: DEAD/DEAH box helicase [Bacillota bacterium]|nr:DEAD/DEAH box helicase [Bacillota bacterium]